ncbi:MAG: FAD-dependent oxidoreductase [Gammaproteobacteria bacterium]|nr:FAD-dependent oxidoreductase [Gammaproteobacteria bacterium]
MQKIVETDIAIVGGGISGLWLLNRLRQLGYSTILLESATLGGGQTNKSQGIIHGGMKYALQGKLTSASQSISDMPTVWKACLAGHGEIDLHHVPVLSEHQYLWSTGKLAGKLTGFFANVALQGRVAELKPNAYPDVFKDPQFKGLVYSLDEMAVDVNVLVRELVKPHQDVIFKIGALSEDSLHLDETGRLIALEVQTASGEAIQIKTQKTIFTAGAGNEMVLKKLNSKTVAMQRRPLHMVVVKSDFSYPVFAHCFGMGATPRITITTHIAADGKTVWYLGGQIAEEGVKLDSPSQIAIAKKELTALFPWLDFSASHFASFMIDRAESAQPGGKRPDSSEFKEIENMIVAWPTKLALAPKLADDILACLQKTATKKGMCDIRALRAFPMPAFAKPIWDELL